MLIAKILVLVSISLTQQKKNKKNHKAKKIVEEIAFDDSSNLVATPSLT